MLDKCTANDVKQHKWEKCLGVGVGFDFSHFPDGGDTHTVFWGGVVSLFGITGRRYRRIGCGRCRCLFVIFGIFAMHPRYKIFYGPCYTTQCNAERLRMNAQWIAASFIPYQTCNANIKLFITHMFIK